jgi:3'(2'), 5'-bisphosphate nucleotidase
VGAATVRLDLPALLEPVRAAARAAADAIMAIYRGQFAVDAKADGSPVTAADLAAERLILAALAQLTPAIPVVAEEAVAGGARPDISRGRFWLVDPLDGTKEFAKRNGEFTVNIGLIENWRPVLGVIVAPASDRAYAGWSAGGERRAVMAEGAGGDRPIHTRPVPAEGPIVVASRSHRSPELEDYIARLHPGDARIAGSSLKFCLVAAGDADIYPRLGRTMEWDTAAGHAIVEAAGGTVTRLDGAPLGYGKPGFENPHFLVRGS